MPFWLVRLACYTSFFSFHSSIYVETIHQKAAPASSISICFSCSYSSRRGREKGLGSWPGIRIFRGFSYVPYARFDKYNHARYIYMYIVHTHTLREREGIHISPVLSIRIFTSPVLFVVPVERKKGKEELEMFCLGSADM